MCRWMAGVQSMMEVDYDHKQWTRVLNSISYRHRKGLRGTAGFYVAMYLTSASEAECYMHIDLCPLAQDLAGN